MECASGGNDCSVECVSGGSDCSVQCVDGVRYLMRGGTPWDVLVKCGRKQGPNCKRIGMVWAHCVATSFGIRNPNICKVVVGSC
jgi:hypothetical protein